MNDNNSNDNNNENEANNNCVNENHVPADTRRFDPVISKISKPLKPQGVHAGAIKVVIKGSF
jgi:hypothetical protein